MLQFDSIAFQFVTVRLYRFPFVFFPYDHIERFVGIWSCAIVLVFSPVIDSSIARISTSTGECRTFLSLLSSCWTCEPDPGHRGG